jgi:arylsulfatase A-like enzyme
MDVAHAGAFSLYVDAIQRADRICGELWTTIQTMPEYKDRTALFIMPDFGRDADGDPGGNGFQHHRTGGAMARTTWLLALGPGIRQNVTVDRAIQPIDLVPTVGKRHGFETPYVQGAPIAELV